MQRVFVLDNQKQPLMLCHPSRARSLLSKGKAAVFRRFPFTIILKNRVGGRVQPLELKLDPGSQQSGVALVIAGKTSQKAVFAAHIQHRGSSIKENLTSRRSIRRARRGRKTRYRPARFNNRTRPIGWIAPSLQSRVNNILTWSKRLKKLAPINSCACEWVRFDTQLLENAEISGIEYQQGSLQGYEIREYVLEKCERTCSYCGEKGIPLEIDHIIPKSLGGTDRVSNLTLACRPCNQRKGNLTIQEFVKDTNKQEKILNQLKKPLKDAAAVNSTRSKIVEKLNTLGLPVSLWSGGRTKKNRISQNYPKEHWIDAVCVGESGAAVWVPSSLSPLLIISKGRGNRQKCRVDAYGFPRTSAKSLKQIDGFKTGDIVKARVIQGKKRGFYQGRVAIRASGSFNITSNGKTVQGIHKRFCKVVHQSDGYSYIFTNNLNNKEQRFLLRLKPQVSALSI